MTCECCEGRECLMDDDGLELSIDALGDGHRYLTASVAIKLAGDWMTACSYARINHCPMCGEKLGGDVG